MSELKKKVEDSASFYSKSFLGFDYKLADYGFRTLKPYFKGTKALELGPASGYMTKQLVQVFETLDAVEGSKDLLDQIPDFKNLKKYHAFFEEFETSETYDTIIMSHVLEHIADPLFVLKRIYQWLKKNGVFIIAVPNAKSIHRLVAVEMGLLKSEFELNSRDHELGHYRVYDLPLLKEHVAKAGFSIVDSGGYFLKPLSNGQIEKNWTEEMIEGFYKVGKHFQNNTAEIFVVCKK